MALNHASSTGWVSVGGSATQASPTSLKVPSGVALTGDGVFAVGNTNGITFNAGAVTDGFPVQANTVFEVPPRFIEGDLVNLWLISGGTVNVRMIYLGAT